MAADKFTRKIYITVALILAIGILIGWVVRIGLFGDTPTPNMFYGTIGTLIAVAVCVYLLVQYGPAIDCGN